MTEKKIETLIPDIQEVMTSGANVPEDIAEGFGKEMKTLLTERLKREPRAPTLRMSSIGKPDRQLWYEINMPEKGEKLRANTYFKFLIGDVLETLILTLAKLAGHKVEGEQDTMELAGIKGHRDAVIDGHLVDVKSASPFSFKKFEEGLTHDKDSFGYLTQLSSYIQASKDDPLVTNKDEGAFFVVQKVTGDMHLDIHKKTNVPLETVFEHKKKVVQLPEPPERCYPSEPMGKSGNMKLGINCSYCAFKHECWPEMRTFLYSTGPVFLTEVVNEPKVIEIDKEGKAIIKDV